MEDSSSSRSHTYAPKRNLRCQKTISLIVFVCIIILSFISTVYGAFYEEFLKLTNEEIVDNVFLQRTPRIVRVVCFIIIFYVEFCLISHYFYCIFRDPGYTDEKRLKPGMRLTPLDAEIKNFNIEYNIEYLKDKMQYCMHCGRPRFQRTHHSSYVNACVLRFDHYCPFLGSIIGLRNYGNFIGILFFSVVSSLLLLLFSSIYLGLAGGKELIFCIGVVLSVLLLIFLTPLFIIYWRNLTKNLLSLESDSSWCTGSIRKNSETSAVNVYNRGIKKNIKEVLPNFGLFFVPFSKNSVKFEGMYMRDYTVIKYFYKDTEAENNKAITIAETEIKIENENSSSTSFEEPINFKIPVILNRKNKDNSDNTI